MAFLDELAAATSAERARLLATPIIGEAASGCITGENYLAFLTQAYHYVRRAAPVPCAVATRLPPPHQAIRQALLCYGDDLRRREDLLVDNIAVAGGDVCAAFRSPPAPATVALSSFTLELTARGNSLGILGLVYVAEGTVASLAMIAADRVQLALGLPGAAFTYLRSHQAFDPVRVHGLAALLNGLTRTSDQAAVLRCARSAFELYADVLRWPSQPDNVFAEPQGPARRPFAGTADERHPNQIPDG